MVSSYPATGVIDQRYHIEAKLGQGASGVVYRVFDNKAKKRLALKLLRADHGRGDGTQRFEREFHAIAKLKHPNILSVFDLSPTYFTMEYVDGSPLHPQEKRDFHTIIRIAIEICRALRYIHSQGIIHGDLKPAHILATANGGIRLIDFGLSEQFDPKQKLRDPRLAAGTLEYMAPERAKGMEIDPRADLYSLGVLLYELSTGRPPFADEDPLALVMKQVETPPRPPREYNPQIPKELEALILKLLAKEPSARCQSVDEILGVLTQLIGRREVQESRIERGSRYLFQPRYVGRARDLSTLEALFQRGVQGEGAIAFVHGEHGIGASRLVNEFGSRHFFGSTVVLNASCEPGSARPYAPFAIWAELGLSILEKRGKPEQVGALYRTHAGGLKKLSAHLAAKESLRPVRAPFFADAKRLGVDLAGLVKILSEIEPVLLILEDAHHLDRLSCQLLESFGRGLFPARALLCVTAKDLHKGEENELSAFLPSLAKLPAWNDMPLQPLGSTAILQLAGSMLGKEVLDPVLAPNVIAAARGNPLIAQETMKALADQGLLYKRGGSWCVDEPSLGKLKPSERVEDWLTGKLDHLEAKHRAVLQAASLLRHRITFDLLKGLTEIDPTTLYYVLSDLVRERLLSETQAASQRVYALASDRLQETVYGTIDERTRRKWHTRAAEALEAAGEEAREAALEDVATHHARGKAPHKALPYLLRCAERYAGMLAYPRAIELFQQALAIGRDADHRDDFAGMLLRMGELFLEQDNRSEARRHLQEALDLARREEKPPIAARCLLRLAEAALRDRYLDEAAQALSKADALYERTGDPAGRIHQRLLSARVHAARGESEQALELTTRAQESASALKQAPLAAEASLARGRALNALGRFPEALEALAQAEKLFTTLEQGEGIFQARLERCRALLGVNQVEEALPLARGLLSEIEDMRPALRVQGYLVAGEAEGRHLQLADAERYLERAVRVAEEMEDPQALAQAQMRQAQAYLDQVRLLSGNRRREALRLLRGARDLLGRAGLAAERDRANALLDSAKRDFVEGDVDALKRERDDLRMLQRVSAAVNSELDLERLLNLIMDMVIEVVKAERGFLILREDGAPLAVGEEPKVRVAVARNIDREVVDRPEFKISNSIAKLVMESRQPILTRDAQTDERFRSKISVLNLKLRSILCVPLLSKQKVIGSVYVDNRFVSEQFNEDNLRLLVAFADQAAIAIDNARLYQDLQQRRTELEEANRAVRILNEQLEQKMVVQGKELAEVKEVLATSQKKLAAQMGYHDLLGRSEAMRKVFRQLERMKETEAPVLIHGESGTGKELVAHLVHDNGPRKDRRFVSENCAAIAPTLLESELFGYVRGAFTGAVKNKKGLFEAAHQGTLFLDEIGDMPLEMQSKLLRVLENGELRPVGSDAVTKVDVRIVAASNKDLEALVREGRFREDLFYRLNVVRIDLPPLRDRREDVPLLLEHFLKDAAERNHVPAKKLSAGALRLLVEHAWPGNVRELKNAVERILLLSAGDPIGEEEVAPVLKQGLKPHAAAEAPASLASEAAAAFGTSYKDARRHLIDEFDRIFIAAALERHDHNISAAAREIGIERQYLHKILKRLESGGSEEPDEPAEAGTPESA